MIWQAGCGLAGNGPAGNGPVDNGPAGKRLASDGSAGNTLTDIGPAGNRLAGNGPAENGHGQQRLVAAMNSAIATEPATARDSQSKAKLALLAHSAIGPPPVIAIQPLGKFDIQLAEKIREKIAAAYDVETVMLTGRELPAAAYYSARGRYRAEKLALFLDNIDTQHSKVLGLTELDISTTKPPYEDWGIFGLAYVGKRPCVISTYRLGRGRQARVGQDLFFHRLMKVIYHELGHTFGLDHCPHQGCIMEDCQGTIRIVDRMNGFCPECKKKLGALYKDNFSLGTK
jgi:archaemetzincin